MTNRKITDTPLPDQVVVIDGKLTSQFHALLESIAYIINSGSLGANSSAASPVFSGAITQTPLSSDPADPSAGNSAQWVSDGTGAGDAGDVMVKINVGGTTKTATLIDYSTI